MTNNVKKIKNKLLPCSPESLRKYRLLGETDKAAEALTQKFLNDLEKYISNDTFNPEYGLEKKLQSLNFN